VAKYCRVNYEICAHCAKSGHSTKGCPNKDSNPSYVNCKNVNCDHAASSANCPMYKKALEARVVNVI
jgi:hypothetical protein